MIIKLTNQILSCTSLIATACSARTWLKFLLGKAGLDVFDADAQAKPPDGEFAEVEQTVRGSKGHAVVAAKVGGQAALLEKPLNTLKA